MDFFHYHCTNQVLPLSWGKFSVSQRIGAIIAGCALGFSPQTALATPTEAPSAISERETCQDSLNGLVSYLDESAEIDGTALRIERRGEEIVALHYKDFIQHMKCRDGELQIDVADPH